jgi:hypothetical protein
MRVFGVAKSNAEYFLPPFEWYNQRISDWTNARNLSLINFTPGTRANVDYTTPNTKNYVSSDAIMQSIKDYEGRDAAGLNGFILLLHIGVGPERMDKFYDRLAELLDWMSSKNYEPVRIDQLLRTSLYTGR